MWIKCTLKQNYYVNLNIININKLIDGQIIISIIAVENLWSRLELRDKLYMYKFYRITLEYLDWYVRNVPKNSQLIFIIRSMSI